MSQLTRKLQKVFGQDGPTIEFGQIGSDNIGSPTTTKDLDTIQSLQQYLDGLFAITNNAIEPPRAQDFNSLHFMTTTQLKYIFQSGIPEWISTENYYASVSIVQVSGDIYLSLTGVDPTPNIGNNPTSSPSDWRKILSLNGSLDPSQNLSDVNSTSTSRSNLGVYSTSEVDTLVSISQITKSTNYTVLNTDTEKVYVMNPNTISQYGTLTLTAVSSGSSVSGKKYRVEHGTNRGLVKIDANGSQKFLYNGIDLQQLTLYSEGDFVEFYWSTHHSKWLIWDKSIRMKTNPIINSNWINRNLSNAIQYNSKSALVDLTGMVIDGGSGKEATVVLDTGGTGTSGYIYFYENKIDDLTSGTYTASDGTTISLTSNPSTINQLVYHGFGTFYFEDVDFFLSEVNGLDFSTQRLRSLYFENSTSEYGISITGPISGSANDGITLRTGQDGVPRMADLNTIYYLGASNAWRYFFHIIF